MRTLLAAASLAFLAATAAPTSGVLPSRLVDSGLYAADGNGGIHPANRPFAPQYPLWSDGLKKRRWVHLPPGTTIDASDPYGWEFPVGTKLWKEFSLGDRKVETRVLWKASEAGWELGTYAWNDAGTDAVLVDARGMTSAAEVAPGRRHVIPGRNDCLACHGTQPAPLGFTALQLSPDRDPNAIHGEPLEPGMLTLAELITARHLLPAREELLAAPPRIRTSNETTRAVLGYLSANCAMCHNGKGEIAAAAPVITPRALAEDGDGLARRFIGQPTRWQQSGIAAGETVLVQAGAPERSALVARMHSRAPSSQMPPLGTVARDQEALAAIRRWIAVDLAAGR